MISILARLGSPDLVGQYALGVVLSTPLLLLFQLTRRRAGASDIRILSLVFALLGIAAVGFLDSSIQDRLVVLLVVMGQSVEWIADLYGGRRGAISLFLHGAFSVATLGILVAATGRAGAGLLCVLVVRLLILFLYDFRQPQREPEEDAASTMIGSFSSGVPCYFLVHMMGFHSLGIFAAAAAMTPAASVLVMALGQAATPDLEKFRREDDRDGFGRAAHQLAAAGLILGMCLIAGAIIAGPSLLRLLFGPEYAGHPLLLLTFAAATAANFVALLLSCILNAGRRNDVAVPLEIAAVAASSVASVLLIPRVGLEGAAMAAGFGFLAQIAGQMCILRSILRHPRKPVLRALLKEPLLP
jgi:O-antigen/teichoic acid export membrane protein